MCGDLLTAFDFSHHESALVSLPDTSSYKPRDNIRHPDYAPNVPTLSDLPRQERGLRHARPLPYDLAVAAQVERGRLKVDLENRGEAGATFYVTSLSFGGGPWTYTLGPRRDLSAEWNLSTVSGGTYDLAVHGPNGFLREFRGSTAGDVEVEARHSRRGITRSR